MKRATPTQRITLLKLSQGRPLKGNERRSLLALTAAGYADGELLTDLGRALLESELRPSVHMPHVPDNLAQGRVTRLRRKLDHGNY